MFQHTTFEINLFRLSDLVSGGVWDLDPMLDRVLVAELPQDLVSGDGGHYVHYVEGNKVGVGEQSKASLDT